MDLSPKDIKSQFRQVEEFLEIDFKFFDSTESFRNFLINSNQKNPNLKFICFSSGSLAYEYLSTLIHHDPFVTLVEELVIYCSDEIRHKAWSSSYSVVSLVTSNPSVLKSKFVSILNELYETVQYLLRDSSFNLCDYSLNNYNNILLNSVFEAVDNINKPGGEQELEDLNYFFKLNT